MRDRTASRTYSPEREAFRRDHHRHRAWGLARRHAERLRQLRDRPHESRPAKSEQRPSPGRAGVAAPARAGVAAPARAGVAAPARAGVIAPARAGVAAPDRAGTCASALTGTATAAERLSRPAPSREPGNNQHPPSRHERQPAQVEPASTPLPVREPTGSPNPPTVTNRNPDRPAPPAHPGQDQHRTHRTRRGQEHRDLADNPSPPTTAYPRHGPPRHRREIVGQPLRFTPAAPTRRRPPRPACVACCAHRAGMSAPTEAGPRCLLRSPRRYVGAYRGRPALPAALIAPTCWRSPRLACVARRARRADMLALTEAGLRCPPRSPHRYRRTCTAIGRTFGWSGRRKRGRAPPSRNDPIDA